MTVPPLHAVTDDAVVARPEFARVAAEVLEAGAAALALHLRAPRTPGRRVYELALALREAAARSGARLIVTDRIDVAAAVGADGVQLGRRSLAPADARRILGPGALIGVSVHSVDEARAAAGDADFLVAGAIYPTASHRGESAAGLGLIRDIAALGIPVIAIGGVTVDRVGEARKAGAAGIAAIRGIWDETSPTAAARRYIERWQS